MPSRLDKAAEKSAQNIDRKRKREAPAYDATTDSRGNQKRTPAPTAPKPNARTAAKPTKSRGKQCRDRPHQNRHSRHRCYQR